MQHVICQITRVYKEKQHAEVEFIVSCQFSAFMDRNLWGISVDEVSISAVAPNQDLFIPGWPHTH